MPTKNDMPDRWYTTKEICAYLGISTPVWVYEKPGEQEAMDHRSRSGTDRQGDILHVY